MKKVLVAVILVLISGFTVKSQNAVLTGKVVDGNNQEPLPFANITLGDSNKVILGTSSDMDGMYVIKANLAGKFRVRVSYIGYLDLQINDVVINPGKTTFLNIKLTPSTQTIQEVVITCYSKPLICQDQGSGGRMTREAIKKSPTRSVGNSYQMDDITASIPKREYKNDNNDEFEAGQLTASELNDFSKWELWQDIKKFDLKIFQDQWELSPQFRYAVQLKSTDEKPIVDAVVLLQSTTGALIWSARSDNTGKAELWLNMFENTRVKDLEIVVIYENKRYNYNNPNLFKQGINVLKIPAECKIPNQIDIAFVVDATGSMSDEIAFLKTDLVDIIQKTKSNLPETPINLGSVFYRCFNNSYVTKSIPLSANIQNTIDFINAQNSGEGGDEVVEEALCSAVDSLNWSPNARARLLFFVMDEPPLVKRDVISKMHTYIRKAAEKGIRIIPIIASAETPSNASSMEYLMRSVALATNGTYVILTDHSGIGDAHAKPTTDQYDVEMLNNLIRRLIYQFSYIPPCGVEINADGISDTTYFSNSPVIAREIIDTSRNIRTKAPREIMMDYTSNSDTTKQMNETDTVTHQNTNKIENSPKVKTIGIRFFPNPTSGPLTVEIDGNIDEFYLTDISGKLISKYSSAKKTRLEIDLSNYSTGIYFIRFYDDFKWYNGKIILKH